MTSLVTATDATAAPLRPVTWTTRANDLPPLTGSVTVVCPAARDRDLRPVQGTDFYADSSSICTAATHAGVITIAAGGLVTIVPAAARAFYVGTNRFGISSRTYEYNTATASFTIAGGTSTPGEISWARDARQFVGRPGAFRFACPADGHLSPFYGTDVYMFDGSICNAAVHAGIVTLAAGGRVILTMNAGLSVYTSSTRHGVTSRRYVGPAAGFTLSR